MRGGEKCIADHFSLSFFFFSSALSFSEGLFGSSNVKVNGKGKS